MAHRGGHRREQVSLVLASAVHVVAFVAAWRTHPDHTAPLATPEAREVAIDVEDLIESVPADVNAGPSASRAIPTAIARDGTPHTARAARPSHPFEDPVAAVEPSATPSSAHDPAPFPAVPPALSLAQLGVAGPNRFVEGPASSSWSIHEAEEGVQRSLAESLLKHDRSVGLGSEGPVIAAIEELVVASTAAVNGRAVLDVMADATGAIIRVACTDGDHSQWDRIATDIAHALDGKRLRAAPGGRGVSMRIEVTSREQLPSGRDPGLEVRAFNLPLKKGRGPRSTRIDIMQIGPRIVIDDTEQEGEGPSAQASPVRFPRAHVELVKIIDLQGDPADIGVSARRVVHAHVLEEHPL